MTCAANKAMQNTTDANQENKSEEEEEKKTKKLCINQPLQ